MKKLTVICVIVSIANFATLTWFAERRDLIKQLLSMAVFGGVAVLVLVSFILGLEHYRREKFHAFIPVLVLVIGLSVSFIGAVWLGGSIKHSRFQQNLPRYNEVVRRIQTSELQPDPNNYAHIHLPPAFADLAWFARVETNAGDFTIEFFVEGGFPVKHSCYLYVANAQIAGNAIMFKDWPIHRRIDTNWFYISD